MHKSLESPTIALDFLNLTHQLQLTMGKTTRRVYVSNIINYLFIYFLEPRSHKFILDLLSLWQNDLVLF